MSIRVAIARDQPRLGDLSPIWRFRKKIRQIKERATLPSWSYRHYLLTWSQRRPFGELMEMNKLKQLSGSFLRGRLVEKGRPPVFQLGGLF